MKKRITTSFLSLLVIFVLAACNMPAAGDGAEADAILQTITAQAQILEQAGFTETIVPIQQTILITATPDAAGAPPTEEVVVPAAVLPPATGAVTVTVSVATNCRSGPGQSFASLYGMPVGQVAKVIAKNTTTGYWIIEIPGQNGKTCWLWGQYATVTGDTATLTNVATPTSAPRTATPTKAATATITSTKSASGIAGCTDSTASNYNSAATVDDGSCTYIGNALIGGCTDPNAINYNANANADDGSCRYATQPNAPEFQSLSCSATGPDANGNYTFNYTTNWVDKSNNENGFAVVAPDGSTFTYPPNTTSHTGTITFGTPSMIIDVKVTAFNNAGIANMSQPPAAGLLCR